MQVLGVFNVSDMTNLPPAFAEFAAALAIRARSLIVSRKDSAISSHFKQDKSYVTELDLAIEADLRRLISVQYPEHGILGEEAGHERLDAEWVWILDPIDGTAPLVAGIPVYGTLIALAHRGSPCMGLIDFPATNDQWLGIKGSQTLHNGRPCATRKGLKLTSAMQCTMNPDFFDQQEKQCLDRLKIHTAWRIYGGSAFSYGRLASGTIDVALDTRLKPHDYAAFVPIIEGAGGVITDWQGRPLTLDSGPQVLAAGDAALHAEALAAIWLDRGAREDHDGRKGA